VNASFTPIERPLGMSRSLALVCLIVLAFVVPAASAATAPARVAFSVSSQPAVSAYEAEGASASVALPGGGVLTFFFDVPTQTTRAIKLARDGALDPSFGTGGVVSLSGPGRDLRVLQAAALPDGRLLIAATSHDVGNFAGPRVVLLRRLATGAPDPSFGVDGIVATSVGASDVGMTPSAGAMAVAPDGAILVTGSMLPPAETNPLNPSTKDWVVARITPAGTLDATFGVVKIPVGSGRRAEGTSVALTASGAIVVLGHADATPGGLRQTFALAGLTALGKPDPAFNGGVLLALAVHDPSRVEPRASGALDVIAGGGMLRFTATGAPDATFATNGMLEFGSLGSFVATPDGGGLLQTAVPYDGGPLDIDRRIGVRRVSAAGALGATTVLYTPFGGGLARPDVRQRIPVMQNTFAGSLLRRDDGTLLVIGGVNIYTPTGKMDGVRASFVAAQAFTAAAVPDLTFGGPQQPASLKVEVRRQRGRTAARRGTIALRVTASQPGLVFLRVRDTRNRVLASGTHPLHSAGSTILRVRLYSAGRRTLSGARRGTRITVRHEYRDILAAAATGVTKGRLP
jgi:uncharacterized delta-60 repeat protein